MVYEDALTILSYASPYDVELEVETGGPGSKPTTLLKKSVGPSPTRICHPLYRSQSIPELSQTGKGTAKRLFTADLNDTLGSSYTAMNSTIKSSKSSAVNQSIEKPTIHEDVKNNHRKFGIKVLPALDGMINRIENQNEHNTNLERRNSKKFDADESISSVKSIVQSVESKSSDDGRKIISETIQQRENNFEINSRIKVNNPLSSVKGFRENGIDVTDKGPEEGKIPSEIPEEVHNAAVAARRNRRNSAELLNEEKNDNDQLSISDTENGIDPKSPIQKNKRKAPAPPKDKMNSNTELNNRESLIVGKKECVSQNLSNDITTNDDKFDSITDYTESLSDYLNKVRETTDGAEARRQRLENQTCRRNSESDTDSELQNSFTTIELNPADITIHHTPVPEVEDDDIYRKAASLGDLSKYESKATSTLERAQSLDMTDSASSKKRKAPLPPEDINESTEDLTKLDDMDTFQRRKLKKSNEWGTLEDAIWGKGDNDELEIDHEKPKIRKKSKGTLERSKSAVEIKLKDDNSMSVLKPFDVSKVAGETSIELYNLPLSKKLSNDFINCERIFNPDADNSLARIVNDGTVVKSPTFEEVELDFRQAKPLRNEDEEEEKERLDLEDALGYFDLRKSAGEVRTKVEELSEKIDAGKPSEAKPAYYYKNLEVVEEPMKKTIVDTSCPGCRRALNGLPNESCNKHLTTDNKIPDIIKTVNEREKINLSFVNDDTNDGDDKLKSDKISTVFQFNRQKFDPFDQTSKLVTQPSTFHIHSKKSEPFNTDDKRESVSTFLTNRTKFEQSELDSETKKPNVVGFETHFAKRVHNLPTDLKDNNETSLFERGSNVTVNSKTISVTNEDRQNVSNVSVSSGDNSTESIGSLLSSKPEFIRQDSETTPPLPSTPMPLPIPHKLTYITEIKVSTSQENLNDINGDDEDIVSESVNKIEQQLGVTVTSNGKTTGIKKPPIPPRRSDVSKIVNKDETEKQVVYVSEYKSTSGKSPSMLQVGGSDVGVSETSRVSPGPGGIGKKFEQWVFLGENKENSWENSEGQSQPVTNIVLNLNDDKNNHK